MEEKNIVLDIIIEFVKAIKTKDQAIKTFINKNEYSIWSCKYLLNQILRQVGTPKERYYVSKKAMKLWKKLSKDDIENYYYNRQVVCECEVPVEVEIYKGSRNYFEKRILRMGDKFRFNSVFHEEHIVPISVIIQKLCELKELNYKNVEDILNKISICRILKSEDKLLNKNHSKKNRPCDTQKVLNEIYKNAGIEIFIENTI